MTVKPQNTVMVSVPPRSPTGEIHAAIGRLDGHEEHVQVMAASLGFATPLELCGLRALVDHSAEHADVVLLDCPTDAKVNRYLARMDFYKELPQNVELSCEAPTPWRRDQGRRLVELCRITSIDDVEGLMDRVWRVGEAQFGSGPMAKACVTALASATENVLDHARSPIGALVAAQRYETTGLELAVVDLGLGIPTTLARNPTLYGLSDLNAVERSLEDKITSTGEKGRGAGLKELVESVQRAGNSTLVIQSGHAHLTLSSRGQNTEIYRTAPGCPVPGTWISVRLQP